MKLKEAFRKQNILTDFYNKAEELAMATTFENVKIIHHYAKAGIGKDEETLESKASMYLIDEKAISFDVLMDVMQFILKEKEKLMLAIEEAKSKQAVSFDTLKQSNILKQQMLLTLQPLKSTHTKEVKEYGTYYGKDKDNKQAIYQYPTTRVITYDINKNHLKAIEQRLRKECNETSLLLDEMLITIDVEYACDILESEDFEEVYRYINKTL